MNDSDSNGDFRNTRRKKAGFSDAAPQMNRMLPQSPEAEQGVIGCILISPNETIPDCVRVLGDEEAFYDLRHQVIFKTLVEMFDERVPIDLITLQQKLKDKNQLDQVGGLAYLAILPDTVPSAANLAYYTEIVKEKATLRRIIHVGTDIVNMVYEFDGEVPRLMDKFQKEVLALSVESKRGKEKKIKDIVNRSMEVIEHRHSHPEQLVGIPTGLPKYDQVTGGLHRSEMVVVAARPSMGKTSLAMNWAEHCGIDLQIAVGVVSLEMKAEKLVERMILSRARVDGRKMTTEKLEDNDLPQITHAAGRISGSKIHIHDQSGMNILQVKSEIRRMFYQYGIQMFILDYLQLVAETEHKGRYDRKSQIKDISNGIKEIASELNIVGVVLSQLNRDIEKDDGRLPRLSDLRESGDIEQDADTVVMIHREKSEDEEETGVNPVNNEPYDVGLVIAKRRNGPRAYVPATFIPPLTKFVPRVFKAPPEEVVQPPLIKEEEKPRRRSKRDE